MAYTKKRNNILYACYTDKKGKSWCKSTRIRLPKNFTPRYSKTGKRILSQDELKALEIARTWENVAKGKKTLASAKRDLQLYFKVDAIDASPIALEWLDQYEPRGGEQHKSNVMRAVELFIAFLRKNNLQEIRLAGINTHHCSQFLGEQLKDNGLSVGTIRGYRSHLTRAFNAAIEEELLTINPFSKATIKSVTLTYAPERKGCDKAQREPFTLDELKIIFNNFPQPYSDLAALAFYAGGLRIGDAISMRWEQVDWKENLLYFITEKTGARLTLPLLPTLRTRLEARYNERTDKASEYLFPDLVRQARKSKGAVSTKFTTMLTTFGIDIKQQHFFAQGKRRSFSRKSFHSLRYNTSAIMRAMGIPVDVARAVTGHNSEAIASGYFQPNLEQKYGALAMLESYMSA